MTFHFISSIHLSNSDLWWNDFSLILTCPTVCSGKSWHELYYLHGPSSTFKNNWTERKIKLVQRISEKCFFEIGQHLILKFVGFVKTGLAFNILLHTFQIIFKAINYDQNFRELGKLVQVMSYCFHHYPLEVNPMSLVSLVISKRHVLDTSWPWWVVNF